MAPDHRPATSTSLDIRSGKRLARTAEILRERRVRLARLRERVQRTPREQDLVDVVDAAMSVDAAVAQARRERGGRLHGAGS